MSELQLYVGLLQNFYDVTQERHNRQTRCTYCHKQIISNWDSTFGSLIGFCSFSQFTLQDKISAHQILLISGRNIWDRGLEEDFVNFMTERT